MRVRSCLLVCALISLPVPAAAQTGGISGTVTNALTAAPLQGQLIQVFNATDYFQNFTTNGSGVYSVTGLAPGTYWVMTATTAGFFNEIYNDIPCGGFCRTDMAMASGTPITVNAGPTTPGIDIALSPGGRITGKLTDAVTLAPIASAYISITDRNGGFYSETTNAMGEYATRLGLPSGAYYVYTSNNQGYLDEIYDDLTCSTTCGSAVSSIGTPVSVTLPLTTAGINFALAKGAVISGRATDATTGVGLQGVYVWILNAQRQTASYHVTDEAGNYTSTGLAAGTYFAYTLNAAGYLDEYFDNAPCLGLCSSASGGTPIVLTAGGTAPGTNFALSKGGLISGTLRAAATGAPIPYSTIRFMTTAGVDAGVASVSETGDYVSSSGLPTGLYYAYTETTDYLNEIYDNVLCGRACSLATMLASGTPIAVTVGLTTPGKNFALEASGRITGKVTDASTGAGVAGVLLYIYGNAANNDIWGAYTNASGDYVITGLPPGSYPVFTNNAADFGLVNEIYGDITCPIVCSETTANAIGTKVVVSYGTTASGIDLALSPAGRITGTVTNAATGAALQGVGVTVLRRTSSGFSFAPGATSDASGSFTARGLPPGTYYAYTSNRLGFIDELLGNVPCLGQCEPGAATLGPAITVASGGTTGGVNFALDAGGRISGRVTSDATSNPLASVTVRFVDASGREMGGAFTDSSGNYISGPGLLPGTYYASAESAEGHLSETYDGVPCPSVCQPLGGTPIQVLAGATTTGRDFALDRGGAISGTVTDLQTGAPMPFVSVYFYDSAGRFVTSGFSNSFGTYGTNSGLATGNYYLSTMFSPTHINEVYDDLPCPGECTPSLATRGTLIPVTAGVTTPGRNFVLQPRTGAPGAPLDVRTVTDSTGLWIYWTPPPGGGVATSYLLEAGLAPGSVAVSFPVADRRYFLTGVPPGRYYLRVRGINGSGVGPASAEYTLVIGAGGAPPLAPRSVKAAMVGARLTLTWSVDFYGGEPTSYLVEAGSATGLANIAVITATTRAFTYEPVPNGFYFLRVRAQNASGISAASSEVLLVVGGVPAPPPAPVGFGSTVSGSTVTLTWIAPPGPVTGYVIEAGSAPGLSNLATLPIGALTTMSFPGIPPGTYYVRIRAVNALGRGVASDEIVVVVG